MSGVVQSTRVESGMGNVKEKAPELGSHVYALVTHGLSESQKADHLGDNRKLVQAGLLPEVSIDLNKREDQQSLLSDNKGYSAGKPDFSVEGIKSRYEALKSEPRESLSEQQVAGVQGAEWAHRMTHLTQTEWGGLIYKNANGGISFTPPISDNLGGEVEPNNAKPLVPAWAQNDIVADYHSHPGAALNSRTILEVIPPQTVWNGSRFEALHEGRASVKRPSENPTGQHFSGDDLQGSDFNQRPIYLGDPIGNVKEFVPPPPDRLPSNDEPLQQFSIGREIPPSANSFQVSDVLPWRGKERLIAGEPPN